MKNVKPVLLIVQHNGRINFLELYVELSVSGCVVFIRLATKTNRLLSMCRTTSCFVYRASGGDRKNQST